MLFFFVQPLPATDRLCQMVCLSLQARIPTPLVNTSHSNVVVELHLKELIKLDVRRLETGLTSSQLAKVNV